MSSSIFPTRRTGNLLSNPEALNLWTSGFEPGTSVTANSTAAPDGTTTADTVTYVGGGTANGIRIYSGLGVASVLGLPYTGSIYLKANTGATTLELDGNLGTRARVDLTSSWQRFSVSGLGDGAGFPQVVLRNAPGSNAVFSVYAWGGNITAGGLQPYASAVGNNSLYRFVVPGSFRRTATRRVVTQEADSSQEYRAVRGARRFLYSMDLEGLDDAALGTLEAFWEAHETWDQFQLEDPITKALSYVRFNMDGLEVRTNEAFGFYDASLEFISVV